MVTHEIKESKADSIELFSSIGSFLLFILAFFSSLFYFCGTSYNFTMARRLGFSDSISDLSIHDTISLGAGLSVVPILIAILLFAIFYAIVLFIPTISMRITFNIRNIGGIYFSSFIGAIVGIFIGIGAFQSSIEAKRISSNIDGKCEECRLFKTQSESFFGISAAQDNDTVYVVTKTGTMLVMKKDLKFVSRINEKKSRLSIFRYLI